MLSLASHFNLSYSQPYAYPEIYEGEPYFDEYGRETSTRVRVADDFALHSVDFCSSFVPYLFNYNRCNTKFKRIISFPYRNTTDNCQYCCKWEKFERQSFDFETNLFNSIQKLFGIDILNNHPYNGQTDTTYYFGVFQEIPVDPKWFKIKESLSIYIRKGRVADNPLGYTSYDYKITAANSKQGGKNYIRCFKTLSNGKVVWEKEIYSGNSINNCNTWLRSLKLLKNGEILIGGNQDGEYVVNDRIVGNIPSGFSAVFACKLSSNGEIVWRKTFSAGPRDKLFEILFNSDDRIYLVGTSHALKAFNAPSDLESEVNFKSSLMNGGEYCTRPINIMVATVIDNKGNLIERRTINTKPNEEFINSRHVFAFGHVSLNEKEEFIYKYRSISILMTSGGAFRTRPPITGLMRFGDSVNLLEVTGKEPAFTIRTTPAPRPPILSK